MDYKKKQIEKILIEKILTVKIQETEEYYILTEAEEQSLIEPNLKCRIEKNRSKMDFKNKEQLIHQKSDRNSEKHIKTL